MHAMQLQQPGQPLVAVDLPDPMPGPGEVRLRVTACGVCRTDLHVVDGELPHPKLPIIPGHEIVGRIDAVGRDVATLRVGERVGVPWLGSDLRRLRLLRGGSRKSLRPSAVHRLHPRRRLRHRMRSPTRASSFHCRETGDDVATAPLLCAGLIGWRSLRMAGDGKKLGLYGFGAAAHIIAQVARWTGPRGLCVHPRRRCRRPAFCAQAWRGVGRRFRSRRRRSRSIAPSSLRRSARWCRRRSPPCARAAAWCAPAFT